MNNDPYLEKMIFLHPTSELTPDQIKNKIIQNNFSITSYSIKVVKRITSSQIYQKIFADHHTLRKTVEYTINLYSEGRKIRKLTQIVSARGVPFFKYGHTCRYTIIQIFQRLVISPNEKGTSISLKLPDESEILWAFEEKEKLFTFFLHLNSPKLYVLNKNEGNNTFTQILLTKNAHAKLLIFLERKKCHTTNKLPKIQQYFLNSTIVLLLVESLLIELDIRQLVIIHFEDLNEGRHEKKFSWNLIFNDDSYYIVQGETQYHLVFKNADEIDEFNAGENNSLNKYRKYILLSQLFANQSSNPSSPEKEETKLINSIYYDETSLLVEKICKNQISLFDYKCLTISEIKIIEELYFNQKKILESISPSANKQNIAKSYFFQCLLKEYNYECKSTNSETRNSDCYNFIELMILYLFNQNPFEILNIYWILKTKFRILFPYKSSSFITTIFYENLPKFKIYENTGMNTINIKEFFPKKKKIQSLPSFMNDIERKNTIHLYFMFELNLTEEILLIAKKLLEEEFYNAIPELNSYFLEKLNEEEIYSYLKF